MSIFYSLEIDESVGVVWIVLLSLALLSVVLTTWLVSCDEYVLPCEVEFVLASVVEFVLASVVVYDVDELFFS